jgi:hypothetical protein
VRDASKLVQNGKLKRYLDSIDPEFISTNKESIDVAHLKKNVYLLGNFDGTLMVKDTDRPLEEKLYKHHLFNRATWVRSIMIDSFKQIWVATSNGLSLYDRAFKIIFHSVPQEDKIKFFGHFRILWSTKQSNYIVWWVDKDSVKIIDARTKKILLWLRSFLKHKDERPNHYGFLDGLPHLLFIVTNYNKNMGMYYVIDIRQRKAYGGDEHLPTLRSWLSTAHLCVAENTPNQCIITSGVSTSQGSQGSEIVSLKEESHLSLFKLSAQNKVTILDSITYPEMKLMTIPKIVFHTKNHTRVLSILTKHIFVTDIRERQTRGVVQNPGHQPR